MGGFVVHCSLGVSSGETIFAGNNEGLTSGEKLGTHERCCSRVYTTFIFFCLFFFCFRRLKSRRKRTCRPIQLSGTLFCFNVGMMCFSLRRRVTTRYIERVFSAFTCKEYTPRGVNKQSARLHLITGRPMGYPATRSASYCRPTKLYPAQR